MMLKSVLRFVFDNIGNPLSSKKIADTMTSEGRKIDTKTVEKYLEAFSESYIIYQAKRYNIKGKQYLKTLEKYYIVDIGMRYMLLGSRQADAGHVLENIVYLELLRRGYDVYVGKINSYEVDFVAQNKKGTVYFQVALTVQDENTLLRELRPLQAIQFIRDIIQIIFFNLQLHAGHIAKAFMIVGRSMIRCILVHIYFLHMSVLLTL